MTTRIEDTEGVTVQRRVPEYQPPRSWRTWLIGRPLPTADAPHQTVGKGIGLAIFASDALSSTAYATQEILAVLAVAGLASFGLAVPISFAIVFLLSIVTLSYVQIILAYPNGGGAYIVSRDNLGDLAAKTAGAALLADYILTVAVSVSSGVAQIASAFPVVSNYRVALAVGLVLLVMLVNLRGLRESGAAFAIPTFFFVGMMLITLLFGFARYLSGSLGMVVDPPPLETTGMLQPITLFLILHAFANGTTALTGVEAISNGTTAFREPRSRNAAITLVWMALILGTVFLGITFLSTKVGAIPSEQETVISQLARTVFNGRGILYLGVIAATTIILIMATNTPFNGAPRLGALLGVDGFLPRQLAFRGSRLVFSRGIILLAAIAIALIVAFQASVSGLIPLYAIGVFLSFTLAQAGMAIRWWKSGKMEPGEETRERGSVISYDPRWRVKMIINGFGAFCTASVMVIFAVTKFSEGAWVVLILIPAIVFVLSIIHRHYSNLAKNLSLEEYGAPPTSRRHRVILPISGVHRGTLQALRYAQLLSDDVTAVHVSVDPEEAEKVRSKWETWGDGVRLVILDSQYRLLVEPLLEYIEEIAAQAQPNETITVIVPQFVPKRWAFSLLHTQAALMLRLALMFKPGIVITDVPYQVEG